MVSFGKLGKYGRWGNCLFQIAATIGYSQRHKVNYLFPEWEGFTHLNHKFNTGMVGSSYSYMERRFAFTPIPLTRDIDLEGYFQSEKYFDNCKDYIREIFKPNSEIENYINEKYSELLIKNTCSIHVRRTDYLEFCDYHYNLGLDYYNKAMPLIDYCTFVVFSDDIEWCKKNLKAKNIIFIEGEKDVVDFYLMSKCKNHIIANSSFSWWASYLNADESKMVIAPRKDCWFGAKQNHSVNDLYLDSWILV